VVRTRIIFYAMTAEAAEALEREIEEERFDPRDVFVSRLKEDGGREEFGYLTHVVNHYDELADLTFFLQADTPDEVFRDLSRTPAGSWHASRIVEKVVNVTAAALRDERSVQFMPLSDEPIGWIPVSAVPSSSSLDFRDSFLRMLRRAFDADLRALPTRSIFAWKNQLFVASRDRLRKYAREAYEDALRYVRSDRQRELRFLAARGSEAFGEPVRIIQRQSGSPKIYPNAADQFERAWAVLFGNCGGGDGPWLSCEACADDCGPSCRLEVESPRRVIGGVGFGVMRVACEEESGI